MQTPPNSTPPTPGGSRLDQMTPYAFITLIVGYGLSLVALLVLAVIHDGALAQQAFQVFTNIALGSAGASGVWGASHTVVTYLRSGTRQPLP